MTQTTENNMLCEELELLMIERETLLIIAGVAAGLIAERVICQFAQLRRLICWQLQSINCQKKPYKMRSMLCMLLLPHKMHFSLKRSPLATAL